MSYEDKTIKESTTEELLLAIIEKNTKYIDRAPIQKQFRDINFKELLIGIGNDNVANLYFTDEDLKILRGIVNE